MLTFLDKLLLYMYIIFVFEQALQKLHNWDTVILNVWRLEMTNITIGSRILAMTC